LMTIPQYGYIINLLAKAHINGLGSVKLLRGNHKKSLP
jgi:hypothetical protein